jgi:hypothetical protein
MRASIPPFLHDPRRAIRHAGQWAVVYLVLACAALVALTIDSRSLPSGDPVALKPLKFSISFVVHCATLGLIGLWTRRAEARDRWFARSIWVTLAALLAETGPIFVQAQRGVPSHFNHETAFDRAMFTIMGLGTIGLVLAAALLLIGLARRPGDAPPLARASVALGTVVMLLGGAVGVMMVQPTAEQAAVLAGGLNPSMIGAHSVGDGVGGKVPLFGWSLVTGDWRVPHFIGVHGLQAMPLMAFALMRLGGTGHRPWRAFGFLASIYMAGFVWSVIRTVQGKSLFLIDGATVTAVAALAAVVALAGMTGVLTRHRRNGAAR